MSNIKELPLYEQPYEKCREFGAEFLTDAELLAVFIRTGTKSASPVDIARNILYLSGKDNLVGLMNLSYKDYINVDGIGDVKAVQMLCLCELSKRIARQNARPFIKMNSPQSIADYYMETLRHETEERVYVILFDTKCSFLGDKCLSIGTVNSSLISPREIFNYALKQGASQIVVIHNHPSGDPAPSNEDIEITNKIFEAGRLIGIELIDHIIIGDRAFISLREIGLINL